MTNTLERRTPRVLILLGALGVAACSGTDTAPHGRGVDKPIDVASIIAGCKDLDDCNRQCTEKSPGSCVSAGRLYEFGHGVPSDPVRAFPLYERACDFKYAGGCYNAAVLLEAGKGVQRNPARAREFYAKVCQMGSKTSCEKARALGSGGEHEGP